MSKSTWATCPNAWTPASVRPEPFICILSSNPDKSLNAFSNHYEDLRGPRLRELEKPMDKISELQLGQVKANAKELN